MVSEGMLPDDVNEEVRDIMQAKMVASQNMKDNSVKTQERMKKFANKNKTEREFEGDMVYHKILP